MEGLPTDENLTYYFCVHDLRNGVPLLAGMRPMNKGMDACMRAMKNYLELHIFDGFPQTAIDSLDSPETLRKEHAEKICFLTEIYLTHRTFKWRVSSDYFPKMLSTQNVFRVWKHFKKEVKFFQEITIENKEAKQKVYDIEKTDAVCSNEGDYENRNPLVNPEGDLENKLGGWARQKIRYGKVACAMFNHLDIMCVIGTYVCSLVNRGLCVDDRSNHIGGQVIKFVEKYCKHRDSYKYGREMKLQPKSLSAIAGIKCMSLTMLGIKMGNRLVRQTEMLNRLAADMAKVRQEKLEKFENASIERST